MVARAHFEPRKSAIQKRSQMMVETLLDATARVLTRDGYDHASTNRIALVAGVSVGSVYQYFPNKESLVRALLVRHNREMLQLLRTALAEVASLDVPDAVGRLVTAMIEAHQIDPAVHRVFDEQVPRMGGQPEVDAIEAEILALVGTYLEERRESIAVEDIGIASFICVTTVESLTHQFVIENPDPAARVQATFVDEVVRLLTGYLQPAHCRPHPKG